MRLDVYQAETARITGEQALVINSAQDIINSGRSLTPLEQSGVLHALQILIENAIGKAKHWLKASGIIVPVSGYDTFKSLALDGLITDDDLATWNMLIGLCNRIVHDYMNVDIDRVISMIQDGQEQFVVDFLMKAYRI